MLVVEITTSSGNTLVGRSTGLSLTTGSGENTFIGKSSGYYVTGTRNTGVGVSAVQAQSGSAGNYNTGVGFSAISVLTDGEYNIALGWTAGIILQLVLVM